MPAPTNHGTKTVLHPVTDAALATAVYTALLGTPPAVKSPTYQ